MADLDRRLHALAPEAFPAAPDVRAAVAARIAATKPAASAAATDASTAEPRARATAEPGMRATAEPGTRSTAEPRTRATAEPGMRATAEPGTRSTAEPRTRATAEPGTRATAEPGTRATAEPGTRATAEPGTRATAEPGARPAARLRAGSGGRSRGVGPRSRWRAVALAAALVLLPTAAVAAVPQTRHAVLEWLGVEHVRVERVPRLPAGLAALDRADLGTRVASVMEAGRRAGFAVTLPRSLGAPDAVFVSAGGIISLAYEPRPGLPRDRQTGAGLLVTQLRARGLPDYVAKKLAGPHTRVEAVRVGMAKGVFVSGEPHELLIEEPGGTIRSLPARLAGNTLAFERGDLVTRLEGRFDRRAALALARSLAPAGP